jgi:DNA polymerase III sliding clamp (beta) subunit (PCNA family)
MILSAEAVRLAYAFAAKQDIRYYLNGINVEPAEGGGALITATDGHRLMQVMDRDATDVEPMIISLDKASQAALKRGAFVSTAFNEKHIAILNSDRIPVHMQVEAYKVEGKFPDWRRVLGKREDWSQGVGGNFNVKYLVDVVRLMDGVGAKERFAPSVSFFTKLDKEGNRQMTESLLFILDGRVQAWGLVMPMRGSVSDPLTVAYGKAA